MAGEASDSGKQRAMVVLLGGAMALVLGGVLWPDGEPTEPNSEGTTDVAPAGEGTGQGDVGGHVDVSGSGAPEGVNVVVAATPERKPPGKNAGPVPRPEVQLSPAEVLKQAGIELAFRAGMTLTGTRDHFGVGLPDGGPTVTVKRSPYDPARRGEALEVPTGGHHQVVNTRGRRFLCASEAPGDRLADVREFCDSVVAVAPRGQVVGIDCQSANVDRDLFTVRLRGADEAIRACFTAAWVTSPGNGKAGFGFRGDVSQDGIVETLEVAADVTDFAAYEELRGCVYPVFKEMAHKMLEVAPGQVSCEFRWDVDGEAPSEPLQDGQ